MKILSLDLIAYGPFHGVAFDLSGGDEGLHLIYGPNEAGKSSTLRALEALLFGIGTRTPDAFRHPYDQLRVGGRLRTPEGELKLIRRKGNKNTLRADDDTTPVDEAELDRALGGITRDTFRLMYGVDHETLVQGGRDILAQRGDVGQALFGTALGTAGLHRVLDDLEKEAKALFLPTGSKPVINQTLRGFKEATKHVKEHTLKTARWVEVDRAFREAEGAFEAASVALTDARQRRSGLERVRNVLPFATRRAPLVEALTRAGDPVDLPVDFADRWQATLEARRAARNIVDRQTPQLEKLCAELAAVVVPQGLLSQGETIEAFHQDLGSYRKAERDLPTRRLERDAASAQARRVLATVRPDLTPEKAGVLRAVLARETKLQDQAREHSRIIQRVETARIEARQTDLDGDRIRTVLAALPESRDPESLRRAVDRAKRGGELDAEIDQRVRAVAERDADLSRRLAALGRWPGPVEALAAAPLPQDATVDRFEKEFTDLDHRLDRNRENLEAAATELARFTRELEAISAAGAVPSEADLRAHRKRRQAGWALVRARWLGGVDPIDEIARYAPSGDLPGAYEAAVEAADEVSDRLRREARRVEQQAVAGAGRDAVVERRKNFESERKALEKALGQTRARWLEAWAPCGVKPLGPAEMRGWLHRVRDLLGRFEALGEVRAELAARQDIRRTLVADLAAALTAAGETPPEGDGRLACLLTHAESRLEALDAVTRTRTEKEKELATTEGRKAAAEADAKAATEALAGWKGTWSPLVVELGLPPDAEPAEALAVLGRVRELFGHLDEAAGLEARMESMSQDLQRFEQQLRAFCERAAPDLTARPPAEGVAELNARLKAGLWARTRRQALGEQRDALASEIGEAKQQLEVAETELARLSEIAGCGGGDEVADRIERHRRQQDLREALDEVDGQILALGDGLPLDALLEATRGVDTDALKADLEGLDTELGELEGRQAKALEARTRARTELERMDGSGVAAAAALEAQEHLALLGDQVERYTRARLAHRLLQDEIQRYREENEGPLLKRAGEIFGRLSLGSFETLKVDYRDDAAVLVGERPDKGRTPVEGMSSGTRDQLYLALRLAAVERALDKGEPLPFIVDDILVNFDDRRSRATLEVLEELACKTQVVLFSHHRGVVELARGLNGKAGVFVHEGWK